MPDFFSVFNEGDTPFLVRSIQGRGGGLDGTQYAKGRYAVRKMYMLYRTQTSSFTLKGPIS